MYRHLLKRVTALQSLPHQVLTHGRKIGLEKESLRVRPNGEISQAAHPRALGSALTNPYITTDYSEALLEFVTPPMDDATSALQFLEAAHKFVYPRMPDSEFIWATSMPCVLDGSDSIRIGEYGPSNAGQMKHVYRRGLGLRYGKIMQAIAGVHYNFSWPDAFWTEYQDIEGHTGDKNTFITQQYFHMTRNLLRNGWLVPYLFGASPAICQCFLDGRDPLPGMSVFNHTTYYEPFGTSLRMGDIGYQYAKDAEVPITVSYADIDSYVGDLLRLISTPHGHYSTLGLRDSDGQYQQLNVNQLQIENEYYSSVRPKQIPETGEMPLLAMAHRGIRYLELRSVDVNIFEPLGLEIGQLHFLEVFMLFSLLQESKPFGPTDVDRLSANMTATAHRGRDPELKLQSCDRHIGLRQWGTELLDQMRGSAELLDKHTDSSVYTSALSTQQQKMDNPELTPSARVIRDMIDNHDSFYDMAQSLSLTHADTLMANTNSSKDESLFLSAASDSLAKQTELDARSEGSFEDYLGSYLKQLSDSDLSIVQHAAKSSLA